MPFMDLLRRVSGRPRVYSIGEITDAVTPVAERYGLEFVYLFGSYARGEATPDSDIDLFVSAHKVRGIQIGRVFMELRNALGKEIDMVTDYGDPRFIKMIGKDMVKLYGETFQQKTEERRGETGKGTLSR